MAEIVTTYKTALKAELTNILDYWMNNCLDEQNGGFIGHIDYFNHRDEKAPKGSVLNARILWTFSAAYAQTKNTSYYEIAERAFQYNLKYFIDREFGGVYWELDYLGNPLNSRKQIYALSFMIYGMVAFYKISNNQQALQTANELFQLIEKHSFDKQYNGYVEALSQDWKPLSDLRLSEKDANESKTMNTHLHILEAYTNLYRVNKSDAVQKALKNLIQLFLEKFINENYTQNLFFDDYWNLKSDEISYGHDIECSWLLHEAAEVLGDEELLSIVREVSIKMAFQSFDGLDSDGGMFNHYTPSTKHLDTDKHWWPQAEAMVGYYNAYQLSGDDQFLKKSKACWEFTQKYLLDKTHGEWFWRVNKEGKPYTEDEKAGFWKCPYHNSRACLELIDRIK